MFPTLILAAAFSNPPIYWRMKIVAASAIPGEAWGEELKSPQERLRNYERHQAETRKQAIELLQSHIDEAEKTLELNKKLDAMKNADEIQKLEGRIRLLKSLHSYYKLSE